MSGTIIIENLTERHLQYRMDHQAVCVKTGKCMCKKGRRGPVATTIHVPGGIGMRTGPLSPAVALDAQIRKDKTGPNPKILVIGSAVTEATKVAVGVVATEVAQAQDDSTQLEKKSSSGRKGKQY